MSCVQRDRMQTRQVNDKLNVGRKGWQNAEITELGCLEEDAELVWFNRASLAPHPTHYAADRRIC